MRVTDQGKRGGVMVVEDDYAIRETLKELLEEEGYRVTQAANGAEALARLRDTEGPPSLILLDLMMPVMDGWEFRDAIAEDPKFSDIPVVVISADHSLDTKVSSMDVQAWLSKPFELEQLLSTIGRYAEHRYDEGRHGGDATR
jgi:CheY-like chemotaxis protein